MPATSVRRWAWAAPSLANARGSSVTRLGSPGRVLRISPATQPRRLLPGLRAFVTAFVVAFAFRATFFAVFFAGFAAAALRLVGRPCFRGVDLPPPNTASQPSAAWMLVQ